MPNTESTTCVIGDIHGCHLTLQELLRQVSHKADTLVFLGDYVDRGPYSKDVISTIISLQKISKPRVIPLMGNHDFLFLQYLTGKAPSLFFQVGGLQTLESYGLSPASSQDEISEKIPRAHRAFFHQLPLWWQNEHAIYVHAGLQPGRHLSQQTSEWCLWAREQFIDSKANFGKPVIFGHTIFSEPFITPHCIGIDTGAVYDGLLTALLLPQMEVVQVANRD